MTATALIAGALGVAGRALVEELEHRKDWQVVGLSRRSPTWRTHAQFVSVDLLDREDCAAKLGQLSDVTHIFFAAYGARATPAEEVAPNLAMLVNLVETIDGVSDKLLHVQLVHGSKWYGNHLGPYETPAREDDPRHMPPNFYYDQQDWLSSFQHGKPWSWSALRPHGLCGISIGSPMNQLTALGVYGSLASHFDLPLKFPGKPGTFDCVYQFTDAGLLARAMVWAATTQAAANEAFNVTNGDFVRWRHMWPAIARFFGVEPGPVQTINLADVMADKEPVWRHLVEQHDLEPHTIAELTDWRFADFVYGSDFDQMSSMTKARRAGWHEVMDSEEMMLRLLGGLREKRLIP